MGLATLVLAGMWAASLNLYDRHRAAQATAWRDAVLHGRTPYIWALDTAREIASGHGLETFTWQHGIVRGDYADPYLTLNLQGRFIDARRYSLLRLRLFSEVDEFLQILHHQGDDTVVHATGLLPVRAGWQVLTFDLPALEWRSRSLSAQETAPSTWGSPAGLVTELRIDPVRNGAFAIDWIELSDPLARLPDSDVIRPFTAANDPVFTRLMADPGGLWFLANDQTLRTPASAHRLRQRIAERFPSAIVFPRLPDANAAPGRTIDPRIAPGIVFVLALLAGLLGWRRSGTAAALTTAAALIAAISAFVFIEPYLAPAFKAALAAPLAGLAWLARPIGPVRFLRGDFRAWLWLAPLLIIAIAVILWLPRIGPADTPLPKTLLVYLGWALIQQTVIALLVFERLRPGLGPWAVIVTAAAFGWLHLPNFTLMAATFVFGLYLLAVYRRHPNLPAIATAHALAAVAVNSAAPYVFWLSREVGPRFLQSL